MFQHLMLEYLHMAQRVHTTECRLNMLDNAFQIIHITDTSFPAKARYVTHIR